MAMVQYSCWSNCNGTCDFCLRRERVPYSKDYQISSLRAIRHNIDKVDWENTYSDGISLLGGELYHITDKDIQEEFLLLIDDIIKKVLKVSKNPNVRYSTVTNGQYDPTFLFKVMDRIQAECGTQAIDINFSYDLKYRYKTEAMRQLALENIRKVHDRYNYRVGVQMILTQYVIDQVEAGYWNIQDFLDKEIPGNGLCFLYPHPIHTGLTLPDFFLKRESLLRFVTYLQMYFPSIYTSFLFSTQNSGVFKATGLIDKRFREHPELLDEQPRLSDGKEEINPDCGHTKLYQCYCDSDACLLCDLQALDTGMGDF